MKKIVLILIVISSFLSLLVTACKNEVIPSQPINIDVLNYSDFYLNTDSVGLDTYTQGTVFIAGDQSDTKARHVQIVAWINVDPLDVGGISFTLPVGWTIKAIVSDFPQGKPDPAKYMVLFDIVDNNKYQQFIKIGGSAEPAILPGGGKGCIRIDIDPMESQAAYIDMNNFELMISAGSKKEAILTVFPCGTTLQIPLNTNKIPSPSGIAD
jgi:hypothetical protein